MKKEEVELIMTLVKGYRYAEPGQFTEKAALIETALDMLSHKEFLRGYASAVREFESTAKANGGF